jgi:alpha-tubulin suppressor-like RCC1 family protein
MRYFLLALGSLAALAGCADGKQPDVPTAPAVERSLPAFDIRDGSQGGGNAGFFWLPPMVTTPPAGTGAFDNSVLGALEVELCELGAAGCVTGGFERRFTSSTGSLTNRVRLFANQQYQVMYASATDNLDPAKSYRATVRAHGVPLGFADIDVVSSMTELLAVDRTRFAPLVRGQTLPISFRVDDIFPAACGAAAVDALAAQIFGAGTPSAAFRTAVRRLAYLNRFASVAETDAALDVLLAELSAQETAAAGDAARLALIAQLRDALYCVLSRPVPPPPGSLSGTVTGTNGRGPLAGVTVRVQPAALTGTTNAAGRYDIAGVPAGAATVSVIGGLPSDCTAPSPIDASVAAGGTTVDIEVACDPPAVEIVPTTLTAGPGHACGLTTDGAAYCWGNTGLALGHGSPNGSTVPVPVSGGLRFTTISAGSLHTCGVTPEGTAYCWGAGGVIGDGTQNQRSTPTPVAGGLMFASVSAGGSHSCGITRSGAAYCWGGASNGRLGDGTTSGTRLTPVSVLGGHTFTSIAVSRDNVSGQGHSCGVTTAGEVYCWGNNTNRQLGGTFPVFPQESATPLRVPVSQAFRSVVAGTLHTCALTTTGQAYCWGYAVAYGKAGGLTAPGDVGDGMSFSLLAAGTYHTCGVTTDATVWCFGVNSWNELGNGTSRTDGALPSGPFEVSGGATFATVAVGRDFSCGVTTAGNALCWGRSSGGELGDGSRGRRASPVPVLGGVQFTTLSSGGEHNCGATPTGTVYCWGTNGHLSGRLGDGTQLNRHAPQLVAGNLSFASVQAGLYPQGEQLRNGFSCGLTTSGDTYCWGGNLSQQLGVPGANRITPRQVNGVPAFAQLALGAQHTCARTSAGQTYCWGGNFYGMLGRGTVGSSNQVIPAPITGTLEFTTIASGAYHSCGLTETGAAHCWGRNNRGQLGDGTSGTDRGSPVPVSGGLSFVSLVGGAEHTCGLTSTGAAYCWGYNPWGQLGNASVARFTSALTPVPVDGGHSFASLGAGDSHSCGVTTAGSAYCWGWNQSNQLGDGTNESSRGSPALVAGGLTFVSIGGGRDHSCGLTTSGAAWCWGWTYQGRVGDEFIRAVAGGLTFRTP